MKKCSICHIEKEKTSFSNKESRCKPCNSKRVYARTKANPTYQSFRGARERCNNPKHKDYLTYGGRGIQFKFKSWQELVAEIGERPKDMSLDRINTNGNYEKGNVRWATKQTQSENMRVFKRTADFIERVKDLYARGFSQVFISNIIGANIKTVGKALHA